MVRRFLGFLMVLPMLASVASCKRPTVRTSCDVPDRGNLTIEATERLNPDENGQALPTIIRIYQLANLGPLELATFQEIWRQDEATLGDALLGKDELTIYPGHTRSMNFERNPDAQFIVGVAIVRRPQGQSWRTIMELPPPTNELRCAALQGQEDPEEAPATPPQTVIHLFVDAYQIEGSLTLVPVEEGGCAPGDLQCFQSQAEQATQVPEVPETPEAPTAPDAPSAPAAPEVPSAP